MEKKTYGITARHGMRQGKKFWNLIDMNAKFANQKEGTTKRRLCIMLSTWKIGQTWHYQYTIQKQENVN